MKQESLALIGEAYRLDLDDAQWFESLARQAARMVPGAMVYSFDASAPEHGVRVGMHSTCGVPDSFVEATLELNRETRPEDASRFYHRGVLCGTVSEMLRADGHTIDENATYESAVASEGFPDTFGLTASSPVQRGVVINSPLPCVTALNSRRRLAW